MRKLRAWFVRLGGLLNGRLDRRRSDREFAQEMESHLQMHMDDNLRSGMTPEEARRNALIKLGGVTQTRFIENAAASRQSRRCCKTCASRFACW
jgi:macrolide transport system ATP-binding/permease protein